MAEDASFDDIRAFVKRHQVCCETGPITAMKRGNRIQVGFEVELSAVVVGSAQNWSGETREHQMLFEGLRKVALEVISDKHGEVRFEIGPFDHSLHYFGPQGLPEVLLKLRILHREDYFRPVGSEATQCLHETEQALSRFGVRRGRRGGR